jgi:hypothetical protein
MSLKFTVGQVVDVVFYSPSVGTIKSKGCVDIVDDGNNARYPYYVIIENDRGRWLSEKEVFEITQN